MAAPLFRSETDGSSASITAVAVSAPSGLTNGDAIIVSIARSISTAPSTVPSGWTLLDSGSFSWTYWKVAASEGSSWTWDFTSSGAGQASWVALAYSGSHATTPVDAHAVVDGATNPPDTDAVAPSVSPTSSTARLVSIFMMPSQSSGIALNNPTTGQTNRAVRTGATKNYLIAGDEALSSSGATGTRANGGTVAFGGWSIGIFSIALKPSAAVVGVFIITD